MTNWCEGTIELLVDPHAQADLLERYPTLDFERILPVPLELPEVQADAAEQAQPVTRVDRSLTQASNIPSAIPAPSDEVDDLRRRHGAASAHEWKELNWNTTWQSRPDIGWHRSGAQLSAGFQTPHGPPRGIAEELSRQYPTACITIHYYVEFIGGGWIAYVGGTAVAGNWYDDVLDDVMAQFPRTNGPTLDEVERSRRAYELAKSRTT